MLSIANVCLSKSWGGLEMSALRWAGNLARRGHQVYTIVAAGSRLAEEARARGLQMVTVPLASRSFDPRASGKIRSFLGRHAIEIVQAHNSKDLWVLYLALVGSPRPRLYYTSRILFKDTTKKDFFHGLIYRRLAGVCVLTEVGKRCFASGTNVPPAKIRVIPNGYDVRLYGTAGPERAAARAAVRAELELADSDLAVGCTSRIDVQKGQYELVEAFRIALRHFSNLKLVLVGEPTLFEGERYLDFLKKKVSEHHLEARVTFAGFRHDIPRVLSGLDIFAMPSYEETFGSCLAEAMLAGLPCISTDAGGVPEVLEGGRVGLLVEPKSVDGLARAIDTLARNAEIRQDLGARARESARRRFDLEGVLDQIEDFYAIRRGGLADRAAGRRGGE
jgi:glycosyltransferase involved in cell wall biosynthesis